MKKNCNFFLVSLLTIAGLGFVQNAWAAGSHETHLRTYCAEPAKGLVYVETSKSSSVADGSYKDVVVSGSIKGSSGAKQNFYGWAKPTRGYKFSDWVAFDYYNTGNSGHEQNREGGPVSRILNKRLVWEILYMPPLGTVVMVMKCGVLRKHRSCQRTTLWLHI